jgi:hypothetical protein
VTWYDIKWDGQTYVENITGGGEKVLTALGIHGYATQALAEANPQTMNDLQAAAGGANVLAGVSGSATNIPTPGGVAAGAGDTAAAAVTGWHLTFGNTAGLLTRILKVLIGGVLLVAGVLKVSGAGQKAAAVLGPAGKVLMA